MDGSQIRNVLFEVVEDLSKVQNAGLQTQWIIQEVRKRLNIGNDLEVHRALLTYYHDLFRYGYLAWGHDLLNAGPPFCHATELGRKALANISRDPANPDGYLQSLNSRAALKPIAQSYLKEALSTYNSGCFKASAVMVGVAAESIVLDLRDALITRLDVLGKSKPAGLTDWKIKTVLDAIEKLLVQKKHDIPNELYERFDSYWSAFTQQIRTARNDSGHPKSIDPVHQDTIHASLLIFPELAVLAKDLMAWVNPGYT